MTTKDELQQRVEQLERELAEAHARLGGGEPGFVDVMLGNPLAYADAPARDDDGNKLPEVEDHAMHDAETVAYLRLPAEYTDDELFQTVVDKNGLWSGLSHGKPSWVAAQDEELQGRLSAWYRCPVLGWAQALEQLERQTAAAGGR